MQMDRNGEICLVGGPECCVPKVRPKIVKDQEISRKVKVDEQNLNTMAVLRPAAFSSGGVRTW